MTLSELAQIRRSLQRFKEEYYYHSFSDEEEQITIENTLELIEATIEREAQKSK